MKKGTRVEALIRFGAFGGTHAIVIGASATGLAATAAVARHFSRVTTLERDQLPDEPVWRKGVPQANHVHALLKAGQNVFNHYLPGLTADMVAQGAVNIDLGNDLIWHHGGGWKLRFNSGITMQCQTRPFLDWHIRRRLSHWPNVEFQAGSPVDTFLRESDRVVGVRLADGRELRADLVIDASGRSSTTTQRLKELGFGEPEVDELPVEIGYSTQLFRPGPGLRDWKGMMIHSRPPATRTAALLPVEGGRWIVTLVGWHGDIPGGDQASFMDWAKGLPVPDLYQVIKDAEPLDRVWRWRFPSNLRRRYDRMANMPDGLVVVGDANTSLNPIYGQGMSQGATGASILDACLEEQRFAVGPANLSGLSARFHKAYGQFLEECWFTSTAEDYGVLDAKTRRAWHAPLTSRFLHRFFELTWHDEQAARAFLEVMHMQKPPLSLVTNPAILRKVLTSRPRESMSFAPRVAI